MGHHDCRISVLRSLLDFLQGELWRAPLGSRNLNVVPFVSLHASLHALHKVLIAQVHLPLEVRPGRFGLDAFRHKLGVTRLGQAALFGEVHQQSVNRKPGLRGFQTLAR